MIHDCVQRHTSSSPPRAPSPSPDGTAAPRMDAPAPPWWQQPPFSCLKENNQSTSEHSWSGDYGSSFEIPRTSLPSSGDCASSIFIHGFKLALFLFFLIQYLNLQLGIFDLQQGCVLSSLSLLIQIQLCIQQFFLCLWVKADLIKINAGHQLEF